MARKKEWKETFPKMDVSSASDSELLDEFVRVCNSDDWTTSSAQSTVYEAYTAELKVEILKRMAS
ncbi:hypothetical protein [Rhizobium sp. BK176]|uniref:hypothetical protein n=1 Tax=Rhizobium sp. BK176 TaxID=2587071 RepID=UPI002168719E|nr:hypothetical protein [Rhizobium sp. BK176]MCS4090145.1 hypothetical protein [Rhizobium sp. BK176]